MTKELTLNKVAAALVGVAMVAGLGFAFAAERAHAITLSELVELFIALEVIPADKADEARAVMAGQEETTTGDTPGALACTGTFTRNLTVGDTGNDVKTLQMLLNSNGFTVATAGAAGSAGMETMYFGPATKSAVTAMQNAFAAEILAPLGLTAGTGYFGASTRAKANALCSASPTTPTTPPTPPSVPGDDDDDDATGDDDDDTTLSGGEASLEDFDALGDPSNEDVDEGAEEAEVYGFEFDVEDADARISRVDVNFEAVTTAKEDEPWRAFEAVQLWLDGDMIAEEDADSESDWSDKSGDVYQMRFSGLSEVVREGDKPEFVVSVTVSNGIDDSDLDQTWRVWVADRGVRARDGAGIDQYTGGPNAVAFDSATGETFTIESASSDTELKVRTSSSNPDSSIIKVENDSTTKDVTVLVFDIEAEDGEVELRQIGVRATTSTTTLATIIADGELQIDGAVVGDFAWDDNCDGTANGTGAVQQGCILFDLAADDDEIMIDADEEVTAELMIDFKKLSGNYINGDTVEFDVDGTLDVDNTAVWEVDDADGDVLPNTKRSGSANGEPHTLQSEGVFAEIVSTDADRSTNNNGTNDIADFEIKFDLTAFDDTFYVSKAVGTAVSVQVEDAAGDPVTITGATTTVSSLSSTAETEGGVWRIDDGETETFTLKVTFDPEDVGSYRLQLLTVDFGDAPGSPANQTAHIVAPTEDFETDYVSINQDN